MTERMNVIGHAEFRNQMRSIQTAPQDRMRHMYCIGKTGTGKSTLYQNMILQDIQAGAGCCFVDPHGEVCDWLLNNIPAERLDDVVLFDPADTEWPLGLNLLDGKTESEKDFLVAEAIQIFYKLFDPDQQGIIGPQFEHWMRNAALTVMADPAGGTLIEIPRLFTDEKFEQEKRRHVRDRVVLSFWEEQMAKTAQFHRSEMLNYFTSKFGRFMTNTTMRNIIGQKRNALAFDEIVNHGKILIVNLSKGRLGELNSYMLGLILMAKLQAAIMRRADMPVEDRVPFYLYVDEFQNVMTETFISMLSEARKYGLAVHLTNQYVAQLTDEVREAVLGNVGTLVAFQIGANDAEALLPAFQQTSWDKGQAIQVEDFQDLPPYHFFIRLTQAGITYRAFRGQSLPPLSLETAIGKVEVQAVNRLRYGQPRELIDRMWI